MLRLQLEREKKGWTRKHLAERAAMAGGDVGKIENGRALAYPSQLKKLARALGLRVSEAASLAEPAPPTEAEALEQVKQAAWGAQALRKALNDATDLPTNEGDASAVP